MCFPRHLPQWNLRCACVIFVGSALRIIQGHILRGVVMILIHWLWRGSWGEDIIFIFLFLLLSFVFIFICCLFFAYLFSQYLLLSFSTWLVIIQGRSLYGVSFFWVIRHQKMTFSFISKVNCFLKYYKSIIHMFLMGGRSSGTLSLFDE